MEITVNDWNRLEIAVNICKWLKKVLNGWNDCMTYEQPDYDEKTTKNTIGNFLRFTELKKYNEGLAKRNILY